MNGYEALEDEETRRRATHTVVEWLEEYCGKEAADHWVWECTPMPIALPLDDQLEEGMQWAVEGPEKVKEMAAASHDMLEEAMRIARERGLR